MKEDEMSSLPLGKYENEQFAVKCAGWNGGYGYSYELGVRTLIDGSFTLIQSRIFNKSNILENGALAFRLLVMNISVPDLINIFEAIETKNESEEFFKEPIGDLR